MIKISRRASVFPAVFSHKQLLSQRNTTQFRIKHFTGKLQARAAERQVLICKRVHPNSIMSNLTTTGFFWVLLSVLSALLASTGFFLPYWIQGNIYNTTVYLGVFRRCNFLIKRKDGLSVLERACGRYASFHDIPSEAWKASTVMIGLGCGLLLLVALTAISSCCLKDIVTKTSARVGGALQFLAGKYGANIYLLI